MFTGIISELGEVRKIENQPDAIRITISAPQAVRELRRGDSVAVNGACLTAVEFSESEFTADVMRETLNKTSLSQVTTGSRVNIELPMRPSDRFGGHLVLGHVDGLGRIVSREKSENWDWLRVQIPENLAKYVVLKGSIAIDGVSLTVNEIKDSLVGFSLIPETLASTTLGRKQSGDSVNVEVDVMAKHLEKLMEAKS